MTFNTLCLLVINHTRVYTFLLLKMSLLERGEAEEKTCRQGFQNVGKKKVKKRLKKGLAKKRLEKEDFLA